MTWSRAFSLSAPRLAQPRLAQPRLALCCLALVLASGWPDAASAQVTCEETFVDPATGEPTTVSIRIDEPLPGSELRAFAPDCPGSVIVSGIASTVGLPPAFDVYLIIDTSGSTRLCAGTDVDGDGLVGLDDPFFGCTDPGDNILQAEVLAASVFVQSVDEALTRVALVTFADAGTTLLRQGLTSDHSLVEFALQQTLSAGPGGATDYGAALDRMLMEHLAAHDPASTQVALFLSDGLPTAPTPPFSTRDGDENCVGGLDVCTALQAADAAATSDVIVHTFGVGINADAEILQAIADRTGGTFFPVSIPGQIVDLLNDVLLVHIEELRVENRTTGETVVLEPSPDGRFETTIGIVPGVNDLAIVAVPEGFPDEFIECLTDVMLACLVILCPPDVTLECDGDGTGTVTSLVATVNDALVTITNDSPHDASPPVGDGDASGSYPLGTTLVTFTFTDSVAGSRACAALVTVVDSTGPVLSGVPPDITVECSEPPPAPVAASDTCDPDPTLDFSEVRVPGPCPDAAVITRTWTAQDASLNETIQVQVVTVVDTTPPVVFALLVPRDPLPPVSALPPASPASPVSALPPASAAAPASACSAPSSRLFEVTCGAVDACDPDPELSAVLLVTLREPQAGGGPCLELVEAIPIDCGALVELRLAAPPCAPQSASSATSAASPTSDASPAPPLSVTSAGLWVVTGQTIVLEVTATDRCGNVGTATFDPGSTPPEPCEQPLQNGTCCPALAVPASSCRHPACDP